MDIFFSSSYIIFILTILTTFPTSQCRLSKQFKTCSKPFNCGIIQNISYPFYGMNRPSYCGHPGFELSDCDQQITIKMKSQTFNVMNINQTTSTITVARQDFKTKSGCPDSLENITIDFSVFNYTPLVTNLTLFFGNCSSLCNSTTFREFTCPMSPGNVPFCWLTKNAMLKSNITKGSCPKHMFLPVHVSDNLEMDVAGGYEPVAAWNGFELKWDVNNKLCETCLAKGGQCGHEPRSNKFFCFCSDESKCPFPVSAIGMAIFVVLFFYLKGRCSSKEVDSYWKRKPDIEALVRSHGMINLQMYKYSDLKKITNSFREKLGEGGNGAVFKGKLLNTEHFVAVKVLKKTKLNAEDFINEVASIAKINHTNIATLLGFCYDGQNRALVYDFMPNGSLEKYLYRQNNDEYLLSWKELYQIALGIAKGIEYLHQGSNKRVLHFDIKPHNILLDEDFCPKISDFGIAKLCPQKERFILISEAGQTVGYIAPEVFIRSFGGVSYKSDVYSYGMLVLELVGSRRKGYNGEDECGGENFPKWIYEQLEIGEGKFDDEEMSSEEIEIQKKMVLVSLWCVKTNPSSRPEMSEVVEMLQGMVESLQAPWIPSLAVSLRSQAHSHIPHHTT